MGTEQIQARTPPDVAFNKSGVYMFTGQDRLTVLAALRLLHQTPAPVVKDGAITSHGKEGIDALSKSILWSDLEFDEITQLFGHNETNPYVASALNLAREGELEVDVPSLICEAKGGAYVMAWLWVSRRDAGLDSADD